MRSRTVGRDGVNRLTSGRSFGRPVDCLLRIGSARQIYETAAPSIDPGARFSQAASNSTPAAEVIKSIRLGLVPNYTNLFGWFKSSTAAPRLRKPKASMAATIGYSTRFVFSNSTNSRKSLFRCMGKDSLLQFEDNGNPEFRRHSQIFLHVNLVSFLDALEEADGLLHNTSGNFLRRASGSRGAKGEPEDADNYTNPGGPYLRRAERRTLAKARRGVGESGRIASRPRERRVRDVLLRALRRRLYGDGGERGHPAPYAEWREVEVEAGLPLGVVGVVEAANVKGELFGFERTREIGGKTAQQIAKAAKAWGRNDDLTVVPVRWMR